ncbi:MAG: peptidylprolyl isomerase [Candidatus Marinimicrobia bacterium]|nr:peptidylprolyl isomerase [Candidatus Neomarinimicrobiota bacterium]
MKRISVLLIVTLLTTILASTCGSKKEYLAKIDKNFITKDQFVKRYKDILFHLSVSDNFELRRSLLNRMIDELILIEEAKRIGLNSDSSSKIEIKKIEEQTLVDLYMKKYVFPRIKISEEELKDFFVRINTRIRARHIFTPSLKEADSLYELIISGKSSFEEIARQTFNDPVLKSNGGDLGYFSIGEMDPWFEDAAFNSEIGKVTRPVKTAIGYSIIKVEDRITNPLLTEDMYNKSRNKIYNYLLFRKKRMTLRTYSDSLSQVLNIRYNNKALNFLYNFIRGRTLNGNLEDRKPVIPECPFAHWENKLSHDEKRLTLLWSKLGKRNIGWFLERVSNIGDKQKRWIKTKENLIEFINGLIIREFLMKEAIRLKIDKTEIYRNTVKERVENYLLKRMKDHLLASNPIPEDTLKAFYKRNKELFIKPPAISLSKITLVDRAFANIVKNMLEAGADFEELARKYSEDRVSGVTGGYIGVFKYNDLGKFADTLFSLDKGEWAGPFSIQGKYYFFRCNDKIPVNTTDFKDVRNVVYKTMMPFWKERVMRNHLTLLKSDIELVINWEILKKININ